MESLELWAFSLFPKEQGRSLSFSVCRRAFFFGPHFWGIGPDFMMSFSSPVSLKIQASGQRSDDDEALLLCDGLGGHCSVWVSSAAGFRFHKLLGSPWSPWSLHLFESSNLFPLSSTLGAGGSPLLLRWPARIPDFATKKVVKECQRNNMIKMFKDHKQVRGARGKLALS